MLKRIVILLLMMFLLIPVMAQDDETETAPNEITTYQRVIVREGPGNTFRQVDLLNPGIPATIVERNRIGNWVRIQRYHEGETVLDGWIIGAYINFPDELSYSDVPENTDVERRVFTVPSETETTLYRVATIPTLSDAMVEVFERGQELGNDPAAVTKIGDSLSASESYIQMFSKEIYNLGPYDFLEPTLLYYRDSTADGSVAAQVGMNSLSLFDPFWAARFSQCEGDENPLQCEFRITQPSVAFILYGPNDVRSMNTTTYREQITAIVDASIDAGVIPVLMTFSTHPEEEFYWQGMNFNVILTEIADEREVPLINLWKETRYMPQYGLGEDLIHLTHPGFQTLKYDTGHEAFYGISLQNLLVLRTLHEIYTTLQLGEVVG